MYTVYQDGNGFVSTSEIKYVLTRYLNTYAAGYIGTVLTPVSQDRPGVH